MGSRTCTTNEEVCLKGKGKRDAGFSGKKSSRLGHHSSRKGKDLKKGAVKARGKVNGRGTDATHPHYKAGPLSSLCEA